MRALLSLYDKTGLEELARGLVDLGFELVSSGGTSRALREAAIPHIEVAEVTGAPEMLGGRVKTLHPAIHGGILADRANPEHMADVEARGIGLIDLVVCNLYPFHSEPSVEMIDVGGPTMIRAAAKNHEHVGVVVDPQDYSAILGELRETGSLCSDTRRRLAMKAFAHTSAYDAAIAEWLAESGASRALEGGEDESKPGALPETIHLVLERAAELRYGENPHQAGARYRQAGAPGWWDEARQRAGTALSYLNIFDGEAAWRLAHEMAALRGSADQASSGRPGERGDGASATGIAAGVPSFACVIVKHANPCGAAFGTDLAEAYRLALDCDPVSAFGGVVALAGHCSREVAKAVADGPQADVVIARSFDDEALEILVARRKATRLVEAPDPLSRGTPGRVSPLLEVRSVGSGFLVQRPDVVAMDRAAWKVATKATPSEAAWRDLELAWLVCARTSSNAIVVVRDGQAIGVGAGQQSRVEAAEIAVRKAGERARGATAASDAFFPFRDGLDVLARAGVEVVIQPGGSVRDAEVIAAADEQGIAMVLTGERHFRH